MKLPKRDGAIYDLLFVYGSLMRNTGHPMAHRLAGESRSLGGAAVTGRLYSLGRYPGAVPSPNPRDAVHGELLALRRPEKTFCWLDDYEGCGESDPEPHAYRRVIVPVRLIAGSRLRAWIYYYRGPLDLAKRIPSGRFHGRYAIPAASAE